MSCAPTRAAGVDLTAHVIGALWQAWTVGWLGGLTLLLGRVATGEAPEIDRTRRCGRLPDVSHNNRRRGPPGVAHNAGYTSDQPPGPRPPTLRNAKLGSVHVVHGTREFPKRGGGPARAEVGHPMTVLGDWYATVLFWKPQAALFVNESTFLPVLLPFAHAATVIDRFQQHWPRCYDDTGSASLIAGHCHAGA